MSIAKGHLLTKDNRGMPPNARHHIRKAITRVVSEIRDHPAILVLLFALIPQATWFNHGNLIAGGDYFPPLKPMMSINSALHAWVLRTGGEPAFLDSALIFPFYSFWAAFDAIGVSPFITQRFWFLFLLGGAGLSMFYFMKALFPERKLWIAWVIASIIYMYNPGVLNYSEFYMKVGNTLGYSFAPLIAALIILGLRTRQNRYIAYIPLASLLLATTGSNPAAYLIPWALAGLYVLYYSVTSEKRLWTSGITFLGKAGALTIAINLWWLVPAIVSIIGDASTISLAQTDVNQVNAMSARSSFAEVFRLLGKATFLQGYHGEPYFPFAPFYYNPAVVIGTFMFPILAFSALVLRPRDTRILFLALVSLALLFLSKGFHPPLGTVTEYLYNHVPYLVIFREPNRSFNGMNAILYAALISISIATSYRYATVILKRKNPFTGAIPFAHLRNTPVYTKVILKIKEPLSKYLPVTILLLVVAAIPSVSWPITTGAINFPDRGLLGKYHMQLPDYWLEATEYLDRIQPDGRVFITPENLSWGATYAWGYDGVDIPRRLLGRPYLGLWGGDPEGTLIPSDVVNVMRLAHDNIHAGTTDLTSPLLGLLNTRYILQRNDLDYEYYAGFYGVPLDSPDHIREVFRKTDGLEKINSFGPLDIYQITEPFAVRHIYAAEDPIRIVTLEGSLPKLMVNYPPKRNSVSQVAQIESGSNLEIVKRTLLLKQQISVDPSAGKWTEDGLQYRFLVNHPGTYIVYLDLPPASYKDVTKILIDTSPRPLRLSDTGELVTPAMPLTDGWHELLIPYSGEVEVPDPGFEEGLWQDSLGDCGDGFPGEPEIFGSESSSDSVEGTASLELLADTHIACVQQRIPDAVPGEWYTLSYSFKTLMGKPHSFTLWQYGLDKPAIDETLKNSAPDKWTRIHRSFQMDDEAEELGLFYYVGPGKERYESRTLFDDVKIRRSTSSYHIRSIDLTPEVPETAEATANEPSKQSPKNPRGRRTYFLGREVSTHPLFLLSKVGEQIPSAHLWGVPTTFHLDPSSGIPSDDGLDYSITITTPGEYNIYVHADPKFFEDMMGIMVDGKPLVLNALEINQEWLHIQSLEMQAGEHVLTLITTGNNVEIRDPGFEDVTWQSTVDDCGTGYEGTPSYLHAKSSQDAYSGNFSLQLEADLHIACVSQTLTAGGGAGFQPGGWYRMSFWYKYLEGRAPSVTIWHPALGVAALDEDRLDITEPDEWVRFQAEFQADPQAERMSINFYSGPLATRRPTATLFDDLRIAPISKTNRLEDMLYGIQFRPEKALNDEPTPLAYTKIDNTKYQVVFKASEPFYIVFNENFNQEWKIYLRDLDGKMDWLSILREDALPERFHTQANGFANAWYIDPQSLGIGNKEVSITVYYRPQSYFILAMVVSTATGLGLAVILLLGLGRRTWKSYKLQLQTK